MNYNLNQAKSGQKTSSWQAIKKMWPLLASEKKIMIVALVAVVVNSVLVLVAQQLIAHTVDTYVVRRDYHGVLVFSGIILLIYLAGLVTSYAQTRLMGGRITNLAGKTKY
jgi:ATP-binding cassette subfamily B protein